MASDAQAAVETGSSRRLNAIAEAIGASTYLEVGIRDGATLQAVSIPSRVGVDPAHTVDTDSVPAGTVIHTMTSDAYFADLASGVAFELIFLDGLHEFRQTYRDVIGAFRNLASHGVILVDDVVPSSEHAAIPDFDRAAALARAKGVPFSDWMGDVFRAALAIIDLHPQVQVRTIVGDGTRPQMAMWLPDAAPPPMHADRAELRRFGRVGFEETFSAGIPPAFNPQPLASITTELRRRVGSTGPAST